MDKKDAKTHIVPWYVRASLSFEGSGTTIVSHFRSPAASSLPHLIITLWWGGNGPQCCHSHAGTDCTTSTFTASDSDPKSGLKLWKTSNWGAHSRGMGVKSKEKLCECVFFTSKQVIHLLPSRFFQVLAERWKSQLEVVPVTDSTPVTSLAPCFH